MFRTLIPLLLALCLPLGAPAQEDDEPETHTVWGVRPAPGSSTTMNPPAFTWEPAEKDAQYAFEIHGNSAFSDPVYVLERTPWSAHCPNIVLQPGTTYHWRYAVITAKGERGAWVRGGAFTVGEKAVVYPQPSVAELAARMPKGHPRLLFRPEQVERLRANAAGARNDLWKELQGEADKLIADLPRTTAPKPGLDIKPKSPEATQLWWANVRQVYRVGEAAATLALAYVITGQEHYGLGARRLLLEMCEWDPKGATEYYTNDEAAMAMLFLPSRVYSWIYPLLKEEDKNKVQEMMQARGRQALFALRQVRHLWEPYNSHYNRTWHFLGEAGIAFYGEIPEAEQWLDYAMTVFFTCYPVWGAEDGGWHEGAAYWATYIRRFLPWARAMQAAFDMDPFEKPFFHEAGYFPLYVLPPGTKSGGFGDTAPERTSANMANVVAILARLAHNPHWEWYADVQKVGVTRDYLGLIYLAFLKEPPATPPTDLPSSRVFRDVGIASLNSDLTSAAGNYQVLFKSSPYGRQSHGYNSNNAFILNMHGIPLFLSSGRRDLYGTPHHRLWMWESKSDNVILINGKGQKTHAADALGEVTLFETHPEADIVAGEAGKSFSGNVRWTRRIMFFKPQIVLIHDILAAEKPSQYQWLLHANGAFSIEEAAARWEGEAGKAAVHFLKPDNLSITQNDVTEPQPAGEPVHQWHLTAETRELKASEEFITLILLDEPVMKARYAKYLKPDRVRMDWEGKHVEVVLERNYFRIEGLGLDREYRR